jgi:dihydrofolate reductase
MVRIDVSSDLQGLRSSLVEGYTRLLTNITPTEYAAQMIKASTVLRGSLVCAYVRIGTGGRAIEAVPTTSIEDTLVANMMKPSPVIMGRTAYNTFGYRLQRTHRLLVVTHDADIAAFEAEGDVEFLGSPALALERGHKLASETPGGLVWVWGGGSTYEQLLPYSDRVMALKTRGAFPGEKLFPFLPMTEWEEVYRDAIPQVVGEDRQFTLTIQRRKKP